MARVGRFQVMAALQAARAVALGLDDDAAKSWGLNRAIFYAAAKRGFRNAPLPGLKPPRGPGERKAQPAPAADEGRNEEFSLGGEKAFLAPDRGPGLRFAFGDDVQTPRDFEWQVERRFADWPAAWNEALDLVRSADPEDLKSQRRFYEHVYRPMRDKLAARWSGAATSGRR